eukprot:12240755-Alexandrium_andersonii.AAC.1
MSASLVGSEMCIRDRPCAKRKIASGVRTWNCAGPTTASKLILEAPRGVPVSYTHLTLPTICSV